MVVMVLHSFHNIMNKIFANSGDTNKQGRNVWSMELILSDDTKQMMLQLITLLPCWFFFSPSSFSFFEKQRDSAFSSVGSPCPKYPQQLGLGEAKARTWELSSGLPHGWQKPAITCCVPESAAACSCSKEARARHNWTQTLWCGYSHFSWHLQHRPNTTTWLQFDRYN